ncbi:uncharacterized protein LOC123535341 [Mercenaria mercenaria]|uniref:uncharacterized protein LOC123535341 n=1 Tax=Mercenaria mercenaria TaxID=6596 RepID=UPI00234EC12E|nr:uncharacterized protein LOC123535341 [Mercenaria mercenaria]
MIVSVGLLVIVAVTTTDAGYVPYNLGKINVAVYKPVNQSSTIWDSDPSFVVDRNTQTCSYAHEAHNWWYVDLEADYPVGEINVLGCCDSHKRGYNISVNIGLSLDNLTEVAFWPGPIGKTEQTINFPNTKTRYVKIVSKKYYGSIDLCDVKVMAYIEHISYYKPTNQSSQYGGYASYKGVDQLDYPVFYSGGCFQTLKAETNWWYVDLEAIYPVWQIQVINRDDSFADRAKNITVMMGDSLDTLTQQAYWAGPLGVYTHVTFPDAIPARYVKLVQRANDYFHLCEVRVLTNRVITLVDGSKTWYGE